jgi:hypothetical protein
MRFLASLGFLTRSNLSTIRPMCFGGGSAIKGISLSCWRMDGSGMTVASFGRHTLGCTTLLLWQIQQHQIGTLLHSFQYNFATVWGDVKVLHVEAGRKVGQLPLDTRIKINPPQIFMLNVSSQEDKSPAARQEDQVSGSASQCQDRLGMCANSGVAAFTVNVVPTSGPE